jgi:hypothetical protein
MTPQTKARLKEIFIRSCMGDRRHIPSFFAIFVIVALLVAWWYFRDVKYEIRVPESHYIQEQNESRDRAMADHIKLDEGRVDLISGEVNTLKERQILVFKILDRINRVQYDHKTNLDKHDREIEAMNHELQANYKRWKVINKSVIDTDKVIKKQED